jgi:hypothetical protein
MNRNNPPFHVARRAAPPLSIPTPPRPNRMIGNVVQRNGQVVGITRRSCGFCAKVRKMLGLGP